MTPPLTCTTWRDDGALYAHPLSLAAPGERCTLTLRGLPGAQAVHVEIRDAAGVCLRAEVPVLPADTVALDLAWTSEDQLDVTSRHHRVLRLPPDAKYAPQVPIRPASGSRLDVTLLIDGTSRRLTRQHEDGRAWRRTAASATEKRATDQPPGAPWDDHVLELLSLLQELSATRPDLRVAVLAFADGAPPTPLPPEIQPAYALHPPEAEQRHFTRFDHDACLRALDRLPASAGGDCVDALADALQACAQLHWRRDARKLLVVSGDSPGYSLLRPAPTGTDVNVRRHDVDTAAARLHADGVEIATVFHAPPGEALLLPWQRVPVDFAREQYARLASRPDLAFEDPRFDGAAAAAALASEVGLLGRDAAYPQWCDDASERETLQATRLITPPAADGGDGPAWAEDAGRAAPTPE